MQKFHNFIENFIFKLENTKISLKKWLIFFFSIIIIRSITEAFVFKNGFLQNARNFFFHFPMFYIVTIISIVLLLHIFTKENIKKIFNILIFFFLVILITPLSNIFLKETTFLSYGYIKSFIDVLKNIFYPVNKVNINITNGMRIEIFIISYFASVYVYYKTKKIWKFILFFPSILFTLSFLIHLPNIFSLIIYRYKDIKYYPSTDTKLLLFSLLLIIESIMLLYYYNRSLFHRFLHGIYINRIFYYLVIFFLGIFMYLKYFFNFSSKEIDNFVVILRVINGLSSVSLIYIFTKGLNDIFDIKGDKISKTKNFLLAFNEDKTLFYNFLFIFAGLLIFILYSTGYTFALILLFFIANFNLYSIPPFRLKRFPIISHAIIAFNAMLILYAGFILIDQDNISMLMLQREIPLMIFFTIFLSSGIKDLKDIKGDKEQGIITIPIIFGEKKGKIISIALLIIALLSIPFFLRTPILFISSSLMCISIIIFIKFKNTNIDRFILYMLPIFVLISFFLFHYGAFHKNELKNIDTGRHDNAITEWYKLSGFFTDDERFYNLTVIYFGNHNGLYLINSLPFKDLSIRKPMPRASNEIALIYKDELIGEEQNKKLIYRKYHQSIMQVKLYDTVMDRFELEPSGKYTFVFRRHKSFGLFQTKLFNIGKRIINKDYFPDGVYKEGYILDELKMKGKLNNNNIKDSFFTLSHFWGDYKRGFKEWYKFILSLNSEQRAIIQIFTKEPIDKLSNWKSLREKGNILINSALFDKNTNSFNKDTVILEPLQFWMNLNSKVDWLLKWKLTIPKYGISFILEPVIREADFTKYKNHKLWSGSMKMLDAYPEKTSLIGAVLEINKFY